MNIKFIKKMVATIKDVEVKYSGLKGKDKKSKAVEIINEFIDIPLLPESVEAKLIGIAVDCIVEVFNELVWKRINPTS